jgi:IS5 family transposase
MINYTSQNQLSLFQTPFEQQLDPLNRWVKLSNNLPWDQLVNIYTKKLCSNFGAPGIDARMVIGSLIIKHKLTLSDRETIEMISENMYMQYFVGLSSFTTSPIFHHTEFVHIRKRLNEADFNSMTEELMLVAGIIEKPQEQINGTGTNANTPTSDIVEDNEADKIVVPNAPLAAPDEERPEEEKELTPEHQATGDIEQRGYAIRCYGS